jgi:hypothetical protein
MLSPRRLALTALAAASIAAAPAAAHAATYTVAAGNGACGGVDLACGTLADAATAAAPGDVFQVAPGEYGPASFTTAGITVIGTAPGVTIRGALTFTGSGAPAVLQRVTVIRTFGAEAAVTGNGVNGLEVRDSLVIGAIGNGIQFNNGTANKVTRSTVFTAAPSGHAIHVASPDDSPSGKALTVDSTIVAGGTAGIAIVTGTGGLNSSAGGVSLTARHVTAPASTDGILLDSSAARGLLSGVGNITATVADSIVLNGLVAKNYPGLAGIGLGANTATFTSVTRTRETGTPASLFVNPGLFNFHLRDGSPAIDQGGFTGGESATDVDGDARPGPVTDQGADEFTNHAPVAALAASPTSVRAGGTVTFSAAGSVDPDLSPITGYAFSFGDGTTATSTSPNINHTYTREGTFNAVAVVVDSRGAVSAASAPVQIRVTDGTLPTVVLSRPLSGQLIRLTRTVRRRVRRGGRTRTVRRTVRNRITFTGTAGDNSGVRRVQIRLRLTARARRRARSSQSGTCAWLDPRRGLSHRRCSRPIEITARLRDGNWTYTVPSRAARRLPAGTYRISATATDNAGNARRITVQFRMR